MDLLTKLPKPPNASLKVGKPVKTTIRKTLHGVGLCPFNVAVGFAVRCQMLWFVLWLAPGQRGSDAIGVFGAPERGKGDKLLDRWPYMIFGARFPSPLGWARETAGALPL